MPSYPIALPATNFAASTILPRANVAVSTSPFTFAQQAYAWPSAQRWEIAVTVAAMDRATAQKWTGWLASLNGREGTFLLGPSAERTPLGRARGAPVVDGAGQTGDSLATSGWIASLPDCMRAGDFLQLGSGSSARLHIVTADADSDANGDAALSIWPSLRSSPSDADAIETGNPVGVFRLAEQAAWSWDAARVMEGFGFSAVEAL